MGFRVRHVYVRLFLGSSSCVARRTKLVTTYSIARESPAHRRSAPQARRVLVAARFSNFNFMASCRLREHTNWRRDATCDAPTLLLPVIRSKLYKAVSRPHLFNYACCRTDVLQVFFLNSNPEWRLRKVAPRSSALSAQIQKCARIPRIRSLWSSRKAWSTVCLGSCTCHACAMTVYASKKK